MSNVIVDGFALYGTNAAPSANDAVAQAMLAGAWAEILTFGKVQVKQGLPWDSSDESYWLVGAAIAGNVVRNIRRVLPAAVSTAMFSFHCAMAGLPASNSAVGPIDFRNAGNAIIGTLWVDSTGAVTFDYSNGTASSAGPVVRAETDHHFECKLDTGAGAFQLYVDGTKVIDITGVTLGATGDVAQFAMSIGFTTSGGAGYPTPYISHLIVRDTNGTYNNTFPVGDRRVATLLPDTDDAAQGWAVRPLHRFGAGVLVLTSGNAGVYGAASAASDLGSGDFTLEGSFRFNALPTGSNKAVLCGKWGETANQRAYQLYLGGPSLENGWLVFRTSTDGTSGTVVEKLQWQWQPAIGRWYHVAVSRSAGVLRLFIDGVQIGGDVADTDTYYATAAEHPVLGVQVNGTVAVGGTYLNGWTDEFRMTVGAARYTANFTPPSDLFPRNAADPDWADVVWLSGWDTAAIANDTGGIALTAINGAAAITPSDGSHGWQVIDKSAPDDTTFIEAALIPATGLLTMTANPLNAETVTVGTTDGTTAAVYTFKTAISTAFDVLIGATISDTADNLVAAINGALGAGTTYGTGTTTNFDVTAFKQPTSAVEVTANVPGTGGNAIASTETLTNGSWGGATLSGGLDIPSYSQFGFSHLPRGAVITDSLTLVSRQWKSDAGATSTKLSFVGGEGGVAAGATNAISAAPTAYFDTIEEDPDTAAGLTPTSILNGLVRFDRTA